MKTTKEVIANIIFDSKVFIDFRQTSEKKTWGDMNKIIEQITSSINTYHIHNLNQMKEDEEREFFLRSCIQSEIDYYKLH